MNVMNGSEWGQVFNFDSAEKPLAFGFESEEAIFC
jgi:hypothetical protein